ncbi:MAG: hypothetical protein ACYCV0_06850 [Desulfitobacteriaceae bacterium]
MNKVIGSKEAFIEKLSQDIYRGLKPVKEEYTMEQLYTRLEELQQEMKSLVKRGMKAGVVDEKEHSAEELFRRFVEKVEIQSMAEVAFVCQ